MLLQIASTLAAAQRSAPSSEEGSQFQLKKFAPLFAHGSGVREVVAIATARRCRSPRSRLRAARDFGECQLGAER